MAILASDTVETRNKENVHMLLEEIFESSLLEADLTDPIRNLTELYASFSGQGFESSFEDILMLTVNESKRSSDVQKIFNFISDFVVSLDNKFKNEHAKNKKTDASAGDDDIVIVHPFMQYLFKTLECWSQAQFYVIRFRSCQLLYMILTNILDIGVGEIDVNTYEKIAKLIQARRKDISANVRANSVLLAKFFQDPSDHSDPVIAGLCWQLENDPNPKVRQNIIDIVAACEETIIPVTRRFLHDKNALVRNAALLHICHRISPRSYTTQHRILILNQCFYDSSAVVRRNAELKLIPMWFRAYGDKLCSFFKSLRLGNECLDKLPFSKDLIHHLFKLVKISQILEEIDLDLDSLQVAELCITLKVKASPNGSAYLFSEHVHSHIENDSFHEVHINAFPKSLNGEKIFIWRHFYSMACRQEKLRKFVPQPEKLAEFIAKSFKESTFEDTEAYTYNELISFTMDILDIVGEEIGEQLPSLAIDIMKNLFVPREVIPYAVTFYCEYASKDTKEIHEDLLQVVNQMLQFVDISSGEEQKRIILKCLDIFSETLSQDNITGNMELISLKDEIVVPNLDSGDKDIRLQALRALSLYCLLDLEDAKKIWPAIEKIIYDSPYTSKENALKSAFDILKCHGCKLFDPSEETSNQFDEVLDNILSHLEEVEIDMNIALKGMFKLYLSHHTYSPVIMGRLILLMFHPDRGHTTKNVITNFLQLYGESKEEAECLTRSFLIVINILFNSSKTSPYHKVSIRTISNQLLEFAKMYEEKENFEIQHKFKDLLVLKLTKQFLKRPWRLPALELQDMCNQILPKDVEKLIKLKANVKLIIESLQSAIFQQKNPFSKRNIKFFTNYMKKIQAAMDCTSDEEHEPERLNSNSSPSNSFLAKVPIEHVSPVQDPEISF